MKRPIAAATLLTPLVCAASALLAPLPAAAQAWKAYAYGDTGFAMQLPDQPTIAKTEFKPPDGAAVPATSYVLRAPDIIYSMTVADFTGRPMQEQAALQMAEKALAATGEVKLDVQERVDRHFGKQMSVVGADGARSTISIFYVNNRLYELVGKSLPPDPAAGSGKAIRFQQSLEFVGLGDEAGRPENRGGGRGFGGPGAGPGDGRRGPPPPEAFEACKGKAAGDAVQFTTPRGTVAASCADTPQGLAARPNQDGRRFGGGAGGQGGPGGLGGLGGPGGPGGAQRLAQALDACKGKAAGDTVQFTTRRGAIAASCVQTPRGLAARPNRPPPGAPPPDGPPPDAPPPGGPPPA